MGLGKFAVGRRVFRTAALAAAAAFPVASWAAPLALPDALATELGAVVPEGPGWCGATATVIVEKEPRGSSRWTLLAGYRQLGVALLPIIQQQCPTARTALIITPGLIGEGSWITYSDVTKPTNWTVETRPAPSIGRVASQTPSGVERLARGETVTLGDLFGGPSRGSSRQVAAATAKSSDPRPSQERAAPTQATSAVLAHGQFGSNYSWENRGSIADSLRESAQLRNLPPAESFPAKHRATFTGVVEIRNTPLASSDPPVFGPRGEVWSGTRVRNFTAEVTFDRGRSFGTLTISPAAGEIQAEPMALLGIGVSDDCGLRPNSPMGLRSTLKCTSEGLSGTLEVMTKSNTKLRYALRAGAPRIANQTEVTRVDAERRAAKESEDRLAYAAQAARFEAENQALRAAIASANVRERALTGQLRPAPAAEPFLEYIQLGCDDCNVTPNYVARAPTEMVGRYTFLDRIKSRSKYARANLDTWLQGCTLGPVERETDFSGGERNAYVLYGTYGTCTTTRRRVAVAYVKDFDGLHAFVCFERDDGSAYLGRSRPFAYGLTVNSDEWYSMVKPSGAQGVQCPTRSANGVTFFKGFRLLLGEAETASREAALASHRAYMTNRAAATQEYLDTRPRN